MPNTRNLGKETKINQYTLDGKFIKSYESMSEASRQIYGNQSTISACVNGKTRKAYGYIWRRADEN